MTRNLVSGLSTLALALSLAVVGGHRAGAQGNGALVGHGTHTIAIEADDPSNCTGHRLSGTTDYQVKIKTRGNSTEVTVNEHGHLVDEVTGGSYVFHVRDLHGEVLTNNGHFLTYTVQVDSSLIGQGALANGRLHSLLIGWVDIDAGASGVSVDEAEVECR